MFYFYTAGHSKADGVHARQQIRRYRSTSLRGPLSSAYPIRRAHSLQLLPSRYRSRRARRVMESETLSIHCRTVSRSSWHSAQWPAAYPMPRPVHPGQTDSRRRKSPRSACGAAPPAQTVLFLLPVHRPSFPPVSTCLLSLCRAAPPAAQISRLTAVTVTRFRALRPLREYK